MNMTYLTMWAGHSYKIDKKYLYMNYKSNYLCDYCRVKIRLKNDNINPGVIKGMVKLEEVNKPDEKQIDDYEVPVSPKWEMVDICKIY